MSRWSRRIRCAEVHEPLAGYVLGALAIGAAVFAGSYFVGHRACVIYCANRADDLSWLRDGISFE